MTVKRTVILVSVAVVLAIAWYASREKLGMGIAVAGIGLLATHSRPLLGIPAAALMAAAVLYVPGVVAVMIMLAVVYVICINDDSPQIQAVRFLYGNSRWPTR